jgi:hypothetical protein
VTDEASPPGRPFPSIDQNSESFMSDNSKRNPVSIFTWAVSCGLAFWVVLGVLIFANTHLLGAH